MSPDLLAATGLLGLAGSAGGAVVGLRFRIPVVAGTTVAACACGLVTAGGVLSGGGPVTLEVGGIMPLSGFSLSLDPLGALFTAVTAVIGICAVIFSLGYHGPGLAGRPASTALPLFVTSMLLVPAASSVTTFLVLWELMALSSLILVLSDQRRRAEVQRAGEWYAAMTQAGAAAILLALVLLAGHAGGQSFAALAGHGPGMASWVRNGAFLLALVGFGSKAGMVPLHVWLPRAHPEAPGPVSALMSAAMVNLGIYGIIRVGDGLLGGGPEWWWLTVMGLGAISALFGALHSTTSTDLKRLLAYSTTDNMGLVLLGVGASGIFADTGHRALALIALVAALLHVVFHAVFKGSLFLAAASLEQGGGSRRLDDLGGLLRRMPVTGTVFLVGSLAISALPPLCGFVSEWLLLQAMLHGLPTGDVAVAVAMPLGVAVLALTGGLTAATFVKAVGIGLLGQPRSRGAVDASEVPAAMWAPSGVLALGCLALGVAPVTLVPAVLRAARVVTPAGVGDPLRHGWRLGLAGSRGVLDPVLLGLGLVAAVAVAAGARRLVQRGPVRRTAAWGCGREAQTSRMEYTATSFAEPLVRVFDDVVRPNRHLDVSHTSESRYYVESIEYHSSLDDDAFERRGYLPALAALRRWGDLARRAQNGSVHRYLAFGLVALLVVLVVVG